MTLGNMRADGVRSLDVSCHLCHHGAVLSADFYMPVPAFGAWVWHVLPNRRRGPATELAGEIGGTGHELQYRHWRDKVAVAARLDEDSFWQAVREIAGRVGPNPILLLSRQAAARITTRFLHRVRSDKPALKIERKPSDDRGGFYIATVEGIDVYGADINPGAAWLFSALLLRAVKYAVVDDEGRRVELTFEPTEDTQGALHMEYVQTTAWEHCPVLEIGLLP